MVREVLQLTMMGVIASRRPVDQLEQPESSRILSRIGFFLRLMALLK